MKPTLSGKANRQSVFKEDAQASQPLLGFGGDHGRAVVKQERSR
jgi:hypothetical protein